MPRASLESTLPISAADERGVVRDRTAAASRRAWYSTLPSFSPAVADRDPVRNADQLQISKHHARTLAAVVQQHLDPGGLELVVQPVGERSTASLRS